ncbi:MAG: type IV secretion protein DotH [Rhodospirillales bacterium]|nr:type IV secretion protein DotH [Rhodospirillales bacterium]
MQGAFAQMPSSERDDNVSGAPTPGLSLPGSGPSEDFSFGEGADTLGFEESAVEKKEQARSEAFGAALQGLLPLRPAEIRTLLERYDRTQESVETPIYPNPKPEVVVQNISLDPGAEPAVIKMAYGHVTTVAFLDTTGAPWPVQNVSWAGNFEIMDVEQSSEGFTHVFRISPQSEFAFGNMSIDLTGFLTPVILTLETGRDTVHYRFDAVIPDYGPLAEAPLIDAGITTTAGDSDISSFLKGVMPADAEKLNVDGVDGRTSAYRYNGTVYVRTPLTLLSPGWSSSAASADGTKVYEINDTPVLLLSDRGRMVRVKLSDRTDVLGDILDE